MNNVERFWSYLGFSNKTLNEKQLLQLIVLLCMEENIQLPNVQTELTLFNYIVDTFIYKMETNTFKHINEQDIITKLMD